jgi:integrase
MSRPTLKPAEEASDLRDVDVTRALQPIRLLDGSLLDPAPPIWRIAHLRAPIALNFSRLDALLAPTLQVSCRAVFAEMLRTCSAAHVKGSFSVFMNFAKYREAPERPMISAADFLSWRAAVLGQHPASGTPSKLGTVLRHWSRGSLSGLAADLRALLAEIRIPGGIKGRAVATMDPHVGPLSDLELANIQGAMNRAYEGGRISLESYTAAWLFIGLGIRPMQLAAMKVCDFLPSDKAAGTCGILSVPRAKQRGQVIREEFKLRKLSEPLAAIVMLQIRAVEKRYRAEWARAFPEVKPSELPLFPSKGHDKLPQGFAFHSTSTRLTNRIMAELRDLGVLSERTGAPVELQAYRFRRTLGTRAARMGAGPLVIAELLDHSDTQNVGVYVQSSPEALERIDKAVALELAPLAQAFAGKLIEGESQATRADDPASRIVNLDVSEKILGNCGEHGFCGLWAGVACYTCSQFQPWVNGPHEGVLDWLLARREARRVQHAEPHMVAVYDRSIAAVAEVVRLCRECPIKGDDA